jgi:hypothetical protein
MLAMASWWLARTLQVLTGDCAVVLWSASATAAPPAGARDGTGLAHVRCPSSYGPRRRGDPRDLPQQLCPTNVYCRVPELG